MFDTVPTLYFHFVLGITKSCCANNCLSVAMFLVGSCLFPLSCQATGEYDVTDCWSEWMHYMHLQRSSRVFDQNTWHMISTILPHILSENKAIATDELHYSLWFHYFTSSQSVWVWQAIVMWVLLFGEKNNNNVTLFLLVGNGHRSSEKSFLLILIFVLSLWVSIMSKFCSNKYFYGRRNTAYWVSVLIMSPSAGCFLLIILFIIAVHLHTSSYKQQLHGLASSNIWEDTVVQIQLNLVQLLSRILARMGLLWGSFF